MAGRGQTVTLTLPATRLHLVRVARTARASLKLRPQFQLNAEQRIVLRGRETGRTTIRRRIDELLQDAARNHELERGVLRPEDDARA